MSYNTMKNILRKFNKIIFMIGIIICLGMKIDYVNAETKNKIKVGYSIIPGFMEVKDGFYSGFLFEYLREIAKYTGWEYEFIEMSLNDVIIKLRDGEIDLAGAMLKNKQTEKLYDFPEYVSGGSCTTLVTLEDNYNLDISNHETFNGIKVGYFEESTTRLKNFKNFCDVNGIKNISFISYPYESGDELSDALEAKEVDAIISGDLLSNSNKKVIAKFGATPYYFATTKGNTEILDDLNRAIFKIKEKNLYYDQMLYNKYFENSINDSINITQEEQEYINSIGVLRAIYVDNNIPVQYYNDKTNEPDGIYIDLVKLIMERAGIKLEFAKVNTYEEAYNKLKNKEADLIIAVPDLQSVSKENNLFLTQSYIDVDIVKVKNKNIETDKDQVALVKGYGYADLDINDEVKYYDTLKECLEAIEKGEATITSTNNYSISAHIAENYYSNLVVSYQENQINSSIGFSKPIDKRLISVVNKAIDTLSSEEINSIIYNNTSIINHKITLEQLFIQNTPLFISILILVIISISMIVTYRFKKLQESKKMLLKKSQIDSLTGIYNREAGEELVKKYLDVKSSNLCFAFAIIDIDYFKEVNDRLGHQVGDNVLKELSLLLKDTLSFKDIIYRLGGDEFIIFMKDTKKVDINIITRRLEILCKTMNKDIEYNNIKQKISLSIGCVISNKSSKFKDLYKQADDILYKVKHNGKNGFEIERDFID